MLVSHVASPITEGKELRGLNQGHAKQITLCMHATACSAAKETFLCGVLTLDNLVMFP